MIICKICNKEFKSNKGLSSHLKIHKIDKKTYYDQYLRNYSKNEGLCLICKRETTFDGLNYGYKKYCSSKCKAKIFSEDTRKKLSEKAKIREKSREYREKKRKIFLEKYGVDHQSKSNEVQNKIRKTCLERYGVEYHFQSEEIKTKIKETCLERYGVENPYQSEEIKTKIKETCLERYGDESTNRINEIINKKLKTKILNNNIGHLNNKPLFNFYSPKIDWIEEVRNNDDYLEVKCKKCDGWFIPDLVSLNNRIAALKNQRGFAQHNLYCSDNCKQTCSIFGQINYQRNQNPNSERPYHQEWALEVKRIANYECEICSSKFNLIAHHIQPVKLRPDLQADIDNGVCLCKECHMKYGHKDKCSTGNLARKIC